MTHRIVKIAGEGIDADYVVTPSYEMPSYPICMCGEETDRNGYCVDCEQYHDGRLTEVEDLGPGRIAA